MGIYGNSIIFKRYESIEKIIESVDNDHDIFRDLISEDYQIITEKLNIKDIWKRLKEFILDLKEKIKKWFKDLMQKIKLRFNKFTTKRKLEEANKNIKEAIYKFNKIRSNKKSVKEAYDPEKDLAHIDMKFKYIDHIEFGEFSMDCEFDEPLSKELVNKLEQEYSNINNIVESLCSKITSCKFTDDNIMNSCSKLNEEVEKFCSKEIKLRYDVTNVTSVNDVNDCSKLAKSYFDSFEDVENLIDWAEDFLNDFEKDPIKLVNSIMNNNTMNNDTNITMQYSAAVEKILSAKARATKLFVQYLVYIKSRMYNEIDYYYNWSIKYKDYIDQLDSELS